MKKFHGHNHGLKVTTVSEQICSVCELQLSGEAYSCTKRDCEFILHNSCSELPKTLHHKSHPEHSFSLLSEPPEYSIYYSCDACGDLIRAFGYQCDECRRRMHVKCALLPQSVECKAHRAHNLDLYYSESKPNLKGYSCDACDDFVTEGYWSYYCKECDFGTHLECAASAEADEDDIPGQKFHGHKHALKLTDIDVLENKDSMCSVCELELELDLEAFIFSCCRRDCEFIIHKSCFELPKTLQHKSHSEHSFSLLSKPPEYSIYYNCDACGDLIQAFGYQCDECRRRMHVKCAFLPESVECKAHSAHKLDLYYSESKANSDGYSFFSCDVCDGGVTEGYWTYYCKECDFGTHLECATSAHEAVDEEQVIEDEADEEVDEEEVKDEDDEEDLSPAEQLARARFRMEQQRMNIEFQMQMSRQNAQFMNSLANSWRGLL